MSRLRRRRTVIGGVQVVHQADQLVVDGANPGCVADVCLDLHAGAVQRLVDLERRQGTAHRCAGCDDVVGFECEIDEAKACSLDQFAGAGVVLVLVRPVVADGVERHSSDEFERIVE